jgi:hypothetical protein
LKCPGCGLERRSVTAPCSVCGTVAEALPPPIPPPLPTPAVEVVRARSARAPDRCSKLVVAKFQIKDLEPDEEPATEKQIGYLKHLAVDVDERELRQLGKWQASDLIEQVLERTQGSALTPGRPVCLHCGGEMQKKLINADGCMSGGLSVLLMLIGVGLLAAAPMGGKVVGVLLIGLVIVAKSCGPTVLRCKACGASAKME